MRGSTTTRSRALAQGMADLQPNNRMRLAVDWRRRPESYVPCAGLQSARCPPSAPRSVSPSSGAPSPAPRCCSCITLRANFCKHVQVFIGGRRRADNGELVACVLAQALRGSVQRSVPRHRHQAHARAAASGDLSTRRRCARCQPWQSVPRTQTSPSLLAPPSLPTARSTRPSRACTFTAQPTEQ